MADILPLIEYKWFDWVKWYNVNAQFPDAKEKLGKWLGPTIDIRPAITVKILKSNGQVLYLSSHRGLTKLECQNPDEQRLMKTFMDNLHEVIGSPASLDDLNRLDPAAAMPENELYEDDDGNIQECLPDIDTIMPKMQDRYIGAKVNLPYQGISRSGKVKRRVTNKDSELDRVTNANPILDT
jgi:hypothetical protein